MTVDTARQLRRDLHRAIEEYQQALNSAGARQWSAQVAREVRKARAGLQQLRRFNQFLVQTLEERTALDRHVGAATAIVNRWTEWYGGSRREGRPTNLMLDRLSVLLEKHRCTPKQFVLDIAPGLTQSVRNVLGLRGFDRRDMIDRFTDRLRQRKRRARQFEKKRQRDPKRRPIRLSPAEREALSNRVWLSATPGRNSSSF